MTSLQQRILAAVKQRGYDDTYKGVELFTRAELVAKFTRRWRSRSRVEAAVADLFHRGCVMRAEDGHIMTTYQFDRVAAGEHLVMTSTGDVALNRGWLPIARRVSSDDGRDAGVEPSGARAG